MMQSVSNSVNRQYMTTDQFCFWLQGLFELCPELTSLNDNQVKMIRQHLEYVFNGKAKSSHTPYTLPTPPVTSAPTPGYPGSAEGASYLTSSVMSLHPDQQPILTVC